MWDLGDDHVKQDARMAHYRDLRDLYARSLEYHGIGYALFQPVAASDMTPPCAGFFDRNGDFNFIAKLSHLPQNDGYTPLEYAPPRVADVGICWKPKTSLGVTALTVDASGNGPDNLPASAEGHVRYSSKSSFGAVLIASRPVTLTGYNDERLFLAWLDANKKALLERHGKQLRKYGMWLVTRTHTAPGCWINAWQSKNREAQLSLKAKANMLGGIGDEMSLDDKSSDRDWTQYRAKDHNGIVVFMDGIEVTASQWTYETLKQAISAPLSRSSSRRSASATRVSPIPSPHPPYPSLEEPTALSVPPHNHRRASSTADHFAPRRRNSNSPAMASALLQQRRMSYSPSSRPAAQRHSIAGVPLLDDLVPPSSPPPPARASLPSSFPLRPPSLSDDCGCDEPPTDGDPMLAWGTDTETPVGTTKQPGRRPSPLGSQPVQTPQPAVSSQPPMQQAPVQQQSTTPLQSPPQTLQPLPQQPSTQPPLQTQQPVTQPPQTQQPVAQPPTSQTQQPVAQPPQTQQPPTQPFAPQTPKSQPQQQTQQQQQQQQRQQQQPPPRPRPISVPKNRSRPISMYASPPPERPNTPGFPVEAYSESNAQGDVTLMERIEDEMDDQVLRDLGLADSLSRQISLTKSAGTISRSSSPRTPSLRREVRNISKGVGAV